MNDALSALAPIEFGDAVARIDVGGLTLVMQNYVAAMAEQAAKMKRVAAPAWAAQIEPLAEPYFATTLKSVRTDLLCTTPVAFKRRNIFVDATIGDRV